MKRLRGHVLTSPRRCGTTATPDPDQATHRDSGSPGLRECLIDIGNEAAIQHIASRLPPSSTSWASEVHHRGISHLFPLKVLHKPCSMEMVRLLKPLKQRIHVGAKYPSFVVGQLIQIFATLTKDSHESGCSRSEVRMSDRTVTLNTEIVVSHSIPDLPDLDRQVDQRGDQPTLSSNSAIAPIASQIIGFSLYRRDPSIPQSRNVTAPRAVRKRSASFQAHAFDRTAYNARNSLNCAA